LNETHRHRYIIYLILAFLCGCLAAGLFFNRHRFASSGDLAARYDQQYGRATEIIGRLEAELERERELNRQLRENNQRARELAEGLANSAERNVRNLHDAIAIIGEIRVKVKALEDFYVGGDTGYGGD